MYVLFRRTRCRPFLLLREGRETDAAQTTGAGTGRAFDGLEASDQSKRGEEEKPKAGG